MKLAIVTPSFNQGQFLGQTMASVLSQADGAVEYHVMDGGSTDDSVRLIQKAAPRLASWRTGPDGGQAAAINAAWQRTQADVVAYLNADDYYLPGTLAHVASLFAAQPEADVVYGACLTRMEATGRETRYQPPAFHLRRLLCENFLPQPAVFIRRTWVERLGWLDGGLQYCMDYDLWLRAAVAGARFVRTERPLACFRIWGGSKTSNDDVPGWQRERRAVVVRALQQPGVPAELQALQAYALARADVAVAYGLALTGRAGPARQVLGQAARAYPPLRWDWQFLRTACLTLPGVNRWRHGAPA